MGAFLQGRYGGGARTRVRAAFTSRRIQIPRRRRKAKVQRVCQCENARVARSARAHAGFSRRGVTRLARRPTQLSRVWSVARRARRPVAAADHSLFAVFSRLAPQCQLRDRALRRGFLAGVVQLELRGSLACAQHPRSLAWDLCSVGRLASCPSLVTVSRGGVAQLVQPTRARRCTPTRIPRSARTTHIEEAAT